MDWTAAQAAIRVVSNKWVISIIAALTDGPLRHSELHRAIGPAIAPKVLTETLRLMQQNRLVAKQATIASVRTTTTYTLTESARGLLEPLAALTHWHRRTTAD